MKSDSSKQVAALRLLTEHPLSLKEAARELPKPVATSTVYRWALRGVRGLKLETVKIGAQLITSREAITRFITALNAETGARHIASQQKGAGREGKPSNNATFDGSG